MICHEQTQLTLPCLGKSTSPLKSEAEAYYVLAASGGRQQRGCGVIFAAPLCYPMMHAMAGCDTTHATISNSVKEASSGNGTESVLVDIVQLG